MATNARLLVIENYPTDDPRLLGEWLGEAGLDLDLVRAHAGQPLPTELEGYAGLLVLGGAQHAYPGPAGELGAPWFGPVESLLRKAVRHRVPTLGVCLGAQLLASAHAGTVAPAEAGPELGPNLVAKRDAADRDPLFGPIPMLPDVVQWHFDDIIELPLGAVLLATSTYHPVQAFRVGESAWGIQFHVEADAAMVGAWAAADELAVAEAGLDAEAVVARVEQLADDLFEVWQPFAFRFAALVRGELAVAAPTGRELPLLGR